jgi:membrane protease YdiL (CAAX protease family)
VNTTAFFRRTWLLPFGLAVVAELVYIAGRTWLLDHGPPSVRQELLLNSWRLIFIPLYLVIFRRLRGETRVSRSMPWHPLLLAALAVIMATPPFGVAVEGRAYVAVLAGLTFPVAVPREELFDHGIVQDTLERLLGPLPAVLLTAIGFTVSHSQVMTDFDLAAASDIAATGLLLGVIYQRTRNLPLVICIHLLSDEVIALTPRPDLGTHMLLLLNVATATLALSWWYLDSRASRPGH